MKTNTANLSLLLLPWLASLAFSGNSSLSYAFAWGGHWLILYMTLSGKIIPMEGGSIRARVMEPIVINQIIFAGFSGISSLFFFLSLNGYYYFEPIEFFLPDQDLIDQMTECQQDYLLGHFGLVAGIVLGKKPDPVRQWRVVTGRSVSQFLLFISGIAFVLFIAFRSINGLYQIALMFEALNLVASILALVFAIKEKNTFTLTIAAILFGVNIFQSLVSGWKEQLLIPFLLLGFFLYQNYPRLILIGAPLVGFLYFTYIPTFNQAFRNLTWEKGEDAQVALAIALESTLEADAEDIGNNNWSFLTNRLSEANMLIRYKEFVPDFHPYYGLTIVQQAAVNLIPRILYKDKPITESVVMQRVFEAGVVSNISNVSAKPAFIADCVLSAGTFGVLAGTFLLGYFISYAQHFSARLFGGYTFGTALMYNSIFNELWRGNCFEFIATTMFWGIVILYVIHRASRYGKIIVPADPDIPEVSL